MSDVRTDTQTAPATESRDPQRAEFEMVGK
jgi:hypothetical protein